MRLVRYFFVVIAVSALGMGSGALFGYLVGEAVVNDVTVGGHIQADGAGAPPTAGGAPATGGQVTLAMNVGKAASHLGAALGAAWGLFAGLGCGLVIGIIDQLILAFRQRRQDSGVVGIKPPIGAPVAAATPQG